MYFCDMTFDVLKSLHIIFVVSWFAGLFYMVRLFIYHTEAQLKEENAKQILSNQFQIMEIKQNFYYEVLDEELAIGYYLSSIYILNPCSLKYQYHKFWGN